MLEFLTFLFFVVMVLGFLLGIGATAKTDSSVGPVLLGTGFVSGIAAFVLLWFLLN